MINGTGSVSGFDPTEMASRIFKRLDTNGNDSIEKSELQTLIDNGASLDIGQLLTDLDTNNDGKIEKDEMVSSLTSLAEELQSRFANAGMRGMAPPDPGEIFKTADSNGDGVIDKTEFAAMGPGDVDEATLDEMFASIDTDGNGSIDEAENEAAMMNRMGMPPGGMPPMGPPPEASLTDDSESVDDAASTVSAVNGGKGTSSIEQLLAALRSSEDDEEDSESTVTQSIKKLVEELQTSTVYSRQAYISIDMSVTQSLFSISA